MDYCVSLSHVWRMIMLAHLNIIRSFRNDCHVIRQFLNSAIHLDLLQMGAVVFVGRTRLVHAAD